MEITLSILIVIILFWIVAELSVLSVYGLPDKNLNQFVEQNINKYEGLNPYNRTIMSASYKNDFGLPFISTTFSVFSRYYIHDHGIVPRWSKAHKIIKARYAELEAASPKQKNELSKFISPHA